jgi:nicotinamide-nucleotide amidase
MNTEKSAPGVHCVEPHLARSAQPIVNALRTRRLSVVTAESCTAGLVAAVLSHAQHAGECFHGGFVAYSKDHKEASLGVDRALLDTNGSVNAEVARQMARGALARSPARLSIAVTGVLGPDPDEDGSPAGLVYFAVCRSGHEPVVSRRQYGGLNPDEVRRCAVQRALELLLEAAVGG